MTIDGANPFPPERIDLYTARRWWSGIPLGQMLDRTCDLYPDQEALVAGEVRLTYRQIREWTDRAAVVFLELGLQKGDRVLLQLPNWVEFVYAYYGLLKIGAVPVFCLPRFSRREMDHFREITEAKIWLGPRQFEKIDYLPLIQSFQDRPGFLKHLLLANPPAEPLPPGTLSFNERLQQVDLGRPPGKDLASLSPDPNETCHLMPTGGTTDLPKLVPRTHNDFYCNFEYRAKAWQRCPRDITLIATPLTHNMAIEVSLNPTFLTGGKVVLIDATGPREILEALERERVTTTILVVAQLHRVLEVPDLKRYDLSSLAVIAGAGSYVPAELIKKVYARIGCKFYNVYGSSEGPCTQTRYEDPPEIVFHSVGRPICPYDEFRVIDFAGQPLAPGQEGELVARGPCIFQGYYKSEAENKEVFTADGFYRTGDLVRFDPEGRMIITGRKKDVIIRGGENISAKEVEELVGGHPDVDLVAAVGMPDLVLGERVCAFIKPKPDRVITFEDVISFLKNKSTSVLYLPERIEVISEIPLTPVGKIDKKKLREEIRQKIEAEAARGGR
ncbi:MAG: AMP-binding protein [Deltaproteobacteria bacterium]|nr:AMP-binding protein [Deltaproteobacteria bacterium]